MHDISGIYLLKYQKKHRYDLVNRKINKIRNHIKIMV